MSDFCRDDDACQFNVTMGDGPLDVVRLCKMVNRGCKVAISNEPFWYLYRCQHVDSALVTVVDATYPMANVLQSADGASAVTAIWSIVLAEMCSEVVGSKRMIFPCVLPGIELATDGYARMGFCGLFTYQTQRCHFSSTQQQ